MKKTLVACVAVAALFAIAGSASAITCTVDTRPAATLLIPYFQATFNPDGSILGTGANAFDTLVTIANASSAPMLAHVSVFNERSHLVLDFNIALTGFDVQAFSMASIIEGNLPQTGFGSPLEDGCQRDSDATVFPNTTGGGFLRTNPGDPTSPQDNIVATTLYQNGPFSSAFLFTELDDFSAPYGPECTGGVASGTAPTGTVLAHGYITIDHANYCSISNPSDPLYWTNDAAGMENNLWGDYIYVSAGGIGTGGFAAVAIEADPTLGDETGAPDGSAAPGTSCASGTANCIGRRTFYRRYVTTADTNLCDPLNVFPIGNMDCGFGDQREPLGLRYAARWFDEGSTVTSYFDIWRASSIPSSAGGLADLLGSPEGACNASEPTPSLTFYDEDENTVTSGTCPSPCSPTVQSVPLETQRSNITKFSHPTAVAGWVNMDFFNNTGPAGGQLDQAWVTYDFQGSVAFLSAGATGSQLDPSTCEPLLTTCSFGPNNTFDFDECTVPVIPGFGGSGIK